jgi:hypothetical protein
MDNIGMDILTDILQQAGLQRRLLDLSALVPGTAMRFPCDKSIGLHAVTQGQVFLIAPTLEEPIALQAGDVALMAGALRACRKSLPRWWARRLSVALISFGTRRCIPSCAKCRPGLCCGATA